METLQAELDDCDYIYDIPIETAKAVCGYRTDESDEPFVEIVRAPGAVFDALEDEDARPRPAAGGGLVGFLKGLFGGR